MNHLGTDIVEISRIKTAVARRGEAFLRRVFTDAELLECHGNPSSLAARFAGKEAVYKALGAANQGIGWRDIEILADAAGKPHVRLNGAASAYARNAGVRRLAISLSHCREFALAVAMQEGGLPDPADTPNSPP